MKLPIQSHHEDTDSTSNDSKNIKISSLEYWKVDFNMTNKAWEGVHF